MSDEAVARAERSALTRPDEFLKDLGLDVELHHRIFDAIDRNFQRTVLVRKDRPARMDYFDGVIRGAHGERVREIVARRDAGDKFVGTFCIYVPEEIILALGAIPVALCGGTSASIPYAEKMLPRDICPLVKSTLGLALSNTCPYGPIEDLAVGETTCDAKKKTWDLLSKGGDFHVLEVPQKKGARDRDLWHEEVRQFKARLEELTGRTLEPDRLASAVRLMNRKRRALARLNAFRKEDDPPISGLDALVVMQGALVDDTVRFTERLEALNDELEDRVRRGVGVAGGRARRIMVSGCPSVMGNWKLHALIESAGAVVVCDETCTGSRYYENPVEETGGSARGPARGRRRPLSQDRVLVLLAERRAPRFGPPPGPGAPRRRRPPICPPVLPHLQYRGRRRGRGSQRGRRSQPQDRDRLRRGGHGPAAPARRRFPRRAGSAGERAMTVPGLFLGLDLGSRTTKIVELVAGAVARLRGLRHRRPFPRSASGRASARDYVRAVATGYGRFLMNAHLDCRVVTEITACALGARFLRPDAGLVIDIGGQDSKVILLGNGAGAFADFEMNDRCAAGTGRFLEVMAALLGFSLEEFGRAACEAEETIALSSMCTVFAESEVISLLAAGRDRKVDRARPPQLHRRPCLPLAARFEPRGEIVCAGGVALNPCLVGLLSEKLGRPVVVPDDPQIVTAVGAALAAAQEGVKPNLFNYLIGRQRKLKRCRFDPLRSDIMRRGHDA